MALPPIGTTGGVPDAGNDDLVLGFIPSVEDQVLIRLGAKDPDTGECGRPADRRVTRNQLRYRLDPFGNFCGGAFVVGGDVTEDFVKLS